MTCYQRIPSDDEMALAVRELRTGGLVIMPTETVYGIAALATLPLAVNRIFEVKGREQNKPIPLLAADLDAIEKFGAVLSSEELALAKAFWPGPLTLVLNLRHGGTEGFRVPDHPVAIKLIREAGGILRVTSCNLSGEPPARSADEAVAALGRAAGFVLDGGPVTDGIPSTVARVEKGRVSVLRAGALSADRLLAKIDPKQQPGRDPA